MDESNVDPLQVVQQLVLMIVEARTPDQSAKGRVEGPHCALVGGGNPAHRCSVEREECVRADQFCKSASHLWTNGIPVCVDILLFPSCTHGKEAAAVTEGVVAMATRENTLLVERWMVEMDRRRPLQLLPSSLLLQAVRSYLHFSQISSWLYSHGGQLPGLLLVYRINPPGEESILEFPDLPDTHTFPVCTASRQQLKVRVNALNRLSGLPMLMCVENEYFETGNFHSDYDERDFVQDDQKPPDYFCSQEHGKRKDCQLDRGRDRSRREAAFQKACDVDVSYSGKKMPEERGAVFSVCRTTENYVSDIRPMRRPKDALLDDWIVGRYATDMDYASRRKKTVDGAVKCDSVEPVAMVTATGDENFTCRQKMQKMKKAALYDTDFGLRVDEVWNRTQENGVRLVGHVVAPPCDLVKGVVKDMLKRSKNVPVKHRYEVNPKVDNVPGVGLVTCHRDLKYDDDGDDKDYRYSKHDVCFQETQFERRRKSPQRDDLRGEKTLKWNNNVSHISRWEEFKNEKKRKDYLDRERNDRIGKGVKERGGEGEGVVVGERKKKEQWKKDGEKDVRIEQMKLGMTLIRKRDEKDGDDDNGNGIDGGDYRNRIANVKAVADEYRDGGNFQKVSEERTNVIRRMKQKQQQNVSTIVKGLAKSGHGIQDDSQDLKETSSRRSENEDRKLAERGKGIEIDSSTREGKKLEGNSLTQKQTSTHNNDVTVTSIPESRSPQNSRFMTTLTDEAEFIKKLSDRIMSSERKHGHSKGLDRSKCRASDSNPTHIKRDHNLFASSAPLSVDVSFSELDFDVDSDATPIASPNSNSNTLTRSSGTESLFKLMTERRMQAIDVGHADVGEFVSSDKKCEYLWGEGHPNMHSSITDHISPCADRTVLDSLNNAVDIQKNLPDVGKENEKVNCFGHTVKFVDDSDELANTLSDELFPFGSSDDISVSSSSKGCAMLRDGISPMNGVCGNVEGMSCHYDLPVINTENDSTENEKFQNCSYNESLYPSHDLTVDSGFTATTNSRRMFQENLLPLASYDAQTDSFKKVEEAMKGPSILHSPKVLFSCDVPTEQDTHKADVENASKYIDFERVISESQFFKTKVQDVLGPYGFGFVGEFAGTSELPTKKDGSDVNSVCVIGNCDQDACVNQSQITGEKVGGKEERDSKEVEEGGREVEMQNKSRTHRNNARKGFLFPGEVEGSCEASTNDRPHREVRKEQEEIYIEGENARGEKFPVPAKDRNVPWQEMSRRVNRQLVYGFVPDSKNVDISASAMTSEGNGLSASTGNVSLSPATKDLKISASTIPSAMNTSSSSSISLSSNLSLTSTQFQHLCPASIPTPSLSSSTSSIPFEETNMSHFTISSTQNALKQKTFTPKTVSDLSKHKFRQITTQPPQSRDGSNLEMKTLPVLSQTPISQTKCALNAKRSGQKESSSVVNASHCKDRAIESSTLATNFIPNTNSIKHSRNAAAVNDVNSNGFCPSNESLLLPTSRQTHKSADDVFHRGNVSVQKFKRKTNEDINLASGKQHCETNRNNGRIVICNGKNVEISHSLELNGLKDKDADEGNMERRRYHEDDVAAADNECSDNPDQLYRDGKNSSDLVDKPFHFETHIPNSDHICDIIIGHNGTSLDCDKTIHSLCNSSSHCNNSNQNPGDVSNVNINSQQKVNDISSHPDEHLATSRGSTSATNVTGINDRNVVTSQESSLKNSFVPSSPSHPRQIHSFSYRSTLSNALRQSHDGKDDDKPSKCIFTKSDNNTKDAAVGLSPVQNGNDDDDNKNEDVEDNVNDEEVFYYLEENLADDDNNNLKNGSKVGNFENEREMCKKHTNNVIQINGDDGNTQDKIISSASSSSSSFSSFEGCMSSYPLSSSALYLSLSTASATTTTTTTITANLASTKKSSASLSATDDLNVQTMSSPQSDLDSVMATSKRSRLSSFGNNSEGWDPTPPSRSVSTPNCMEGEVRGRGHQRSSGPRSSLLQQSLYNIAKESKENRRSTISGASMVFNSRTSLPTQSSPAPLKRNPGGTFDYDSTLVSVKAIKNAFSCSKLALGDKERDDDDDRKRTLSTSAPASTNCLLGNFEESILNGRIDPVGTVSGFTAEIGASGSFCPKHIHLPVSAFFFDLSDDKAPSPYLGHINLRSIGSKKGYHIPKKGTVQVTLFNPNKTVVKMFVVMYDLTDMPTSSQTFIRQRTMYMPCDRNSTAPSYLRYLIHLRCYSSRSGKIYLHTDIRLIFARHKLDIDAKTVPYEMKSFTELPKNPKYSPKK